MNCPSCGTANQEGAPSCAICGATIPTAPVRKGSLAAPKTRLVTDETPPPVVVSAPPPPADPPPHPKLKAAPTRMVTEATPPAAPPPPAPLPPAPPPARIGDPAPANLLRAGPTRMAPGVGLHGPSNEEPARVERVPVQQVSNVLEPEPVPPAVPAASLHLAVADNVRAIAIWYILYGFVTAVAGAFMVMGNLFGLILLAGGVLFLTTGVLIMANRPQGRMLGMVFGLVNVVVAACLAAGVSGVRPDLVWAGLPAVFGIMSILGLISPQAAEVCTVAYRQRLDDDERGVSSTNLKTPFFWIPGAMTGIVLLWQMGILAFHK